MYGRRLRVQGIVVPLLGLMLAACATPLMGRLVTIRVVKAPEVDAGKFQSIGVVPFRSPDRNVGARMADDLARKLNREPPAVRLISTEKDLSLEPDSLRRLAKLAEVQALVVGEVFEYSVQVARKSTPLLSFPDFGMDNPETLAWFTLQEDPILGDLSYPSLQPRVAPRTVDALITRASYRLSLKVRLIEGDTGRTLWEREISRHLERRSLPDSPVDAQAVVMGLRQSIIEELARSLMPSEATVQRMLRPLRPYEDPKAGQLVREGIDAVGKDDWGTAERFFREAAALVPDAPAVHGNLGVVYERSGRFIEAYAAYQRAYECQPADPTYRYYGSDLQRAFVPDPSKDHLPVLVLAVRADGVLYVAGGREAGHRVDDGFVVCRIDVRRGAPSGKITEVNEVEIARGKIVEVVGDVSLGHVLVRDPDLEVRRGDVVRFAGREP
jgi:tetratricopeptide (TPR) repeat protein